MANIYYTHSGYPATGGTGSSASMRAELDLIQAAFDKMPVPTGNANKLVVINSSGTSMTIASGVLATSLVVQDPTDTTKQAQFSLSGVTTGTTRTLTVPDASDTLALVATAQTLSNKTLASAILTGNTLFSSTAARIQGDFSNATVGNRTAFQDKTTNNQTSVYILPNGTSSIAGIYGWNNSDPTNAAYGGFGLTSTAYQISTSFTGSGTALPMTFSTNNAEVGRFDGAGRFCVGVVTPGALSGSVNAIGYASRSGTTGSFSGNAWNIYWTGSAAVLYMDTGSLGTINTTSDYRIKKNVVTQTANAVARINAIRPVLYEVADVEMFTADGVTREGFIAHELAEIIPSAVEGVKDGLTSDGKIQPQTLRLDPIIAVLTKAVQELAARVAALEAV